MKKLLVIVVLGLLLCGSAYAEKYFKYETVVGCGPKKIRLI